MAKRKFPMRANWGCPHGVKGSVAARVVPLSSGNALGWALAATWGALCLSGCNTPGATTTSQSDATSIGGSQSSSGLSDASSWVQSTFASDAFTPLPTIPVTGGTGNGGSSGGPLGPPFGTSTACGDAMVGPSEECDDGNEGSDACTAACQTRDQAARAGSDGSDRYLGNGRHPVAGSDTGFINTYVEFPEVNGLPGEAAIGVSAFDIWGKPRGHVIVSEGASPTDEANPVAAGLPNGEFAVAWSDFDGDGSDLGVAMRKVRVDGSLGPLKIANAAREFSQQNPDMLWTGTQLVVAWEDYSEAVAGPDLRYRLFDAELNPLSGDLALAASSLPEGAVALAPFNAGWAAAYREGTQDGKENVVVRVGEKAFRVEPVLGGPLEDRPALVGLDATHLLVAFSAGTDPDTTGVSNLPRLRYAVIDTTGAAVQASRALDPMDDVLSGNARVAQMSPSLAAGPDGTSTAYLAWRSEGRPGDAAGDQLWLKYLSWNPALETPLAVGEAEMLIPRVCEGSIGDQRRPQLAKVGLPPAGALAVTWDDYSHSQGVASGDPDVVVHYAPMKVRPTGAPAVVTETFTGSDGAPWSSQWQHIPATTPALLSGNRGRMVWTTLPAGAHSVIRDHKALDVDLSARVKLSANEIGIGLVARLAEGPPASYLTAIFGSRVNDDWRISAFVDGSEIRIKVGPRPQQFVNWGPDVDVFVRFRVASNPDNTINVASKLWVADLPEPSAWTVSGTATDSRILSKLGSTTGRFGVSSWTILGGNRTVTWDDFRATFYEGTLTGDPTAPTTTAPLLRANAAYRTCTEGHPCVVAQGCCLGNQDCASGLSCQSTQSELLGLGSHARVCSASHCADHLRNADEPRVDCGGADCAPCCSTTGTPGTSGYCSAACPCGVGEGVCSLTTCAAGTTCVANGLRYGFATNIAVCTPFHCRNLVQDSVVGETGVDCGGECGSCP
jgi:hypothetical protein